MSLTYEPFYGLREKPFSLSADPRFLFRSPAHGAAFDDVLMGIRRREGLVALTGEIGTGKTTLCRSVLQHLDRRTFSAFVADPFVSREDLLKTLLVDFGVISIADLTRGRFDGASRSDLSYPLYEFLDSLVPLQAFAVLVIDEAQHLSVPLLEEIRILSELERREKLLQVVLVGQPELREKLRLPEMRQVEQRVSVRCELTPLDLTGVDGYVNHRLKVAAVGESRVEFTIAALDAIYEGSAGIPRLINRICDRALQHGYAARSMQIDSGFVWEALDDLGLSSAPATPGRAIDKNVTTAAVDDPVVAQLAQLSLDALPVDVAEAQAPAMSESVASNAAERESDSDNDAAVAAAVAVAPPAGRSLSPRFWAAAAVASLFAISVSVGLPGARVGEEVITGLLPPPARVFVPPAVIVPHADAAFVSALPVASTMQEPVPAQRGNYSILVASFENRARALRLVAELTAAGYPARAVDRDGGRLVQVDVPGYSSMIEVDRDLQRIRELPGGYGDARIVERQ
jgi:general secretion pathway protein A